ncbi:MAG: hypothetical protein JWP01_2426 [Myxococcales bacterium]|nr:hypothetical protein [Myxococcales bacterium]
MGRNHGRNHWIAAAIALGIVGAGPAMVEAKGSVTLTFKSNPVPAPNNQYAPNNVLAVWVQAAGGAFVKTIGRWSLVRTQHLVAWNTAAGPNDVDAVVSASRIANNGVETITWNLRNKQNATVPDGTYTIRLEMAEANSTQPAQNNQGTFTFVKGPAPQVQTALTNGGFSNVTINFDPNAASCGDGIVDPPETCDDGPAGNCPRICPAPADACMPSVVVGTPAMCNAACVVQPITSCTSGDGCCAVGCEATDDDCEGGGGGGGGNNAAGEDTGEITGGCAAGGEGGLASFVLFGAALLFRRRSR